jgi:hypothetical protein
LAQAAAGWGKMRAKRKALTSKIKMKGARMRRWFV